MSRDEKLIQKVESHRKGLFPFADLRRYLELYGWAFVRTNGSHMIFRRSEDPVRQFTAPTIRGRHVKEIYVHKAVQLVKEVTGSEGV